MAKLRGGKPGAASREQRVCSRRVGGSRAARGREGEKGGRVCAWIQLCLKPAPSPPTAQFSAWSHKASLLSELIPAGLLSLTVRNTGKRPGRALWVGHRALSCLYPWVLGRRASSTGVGVEGAPNLLVRAQLGLSNITTQPASGSPAPLRCSLFYILPRWTVNPNRSTGPFFGSFLVSKTRPP